MGRIRYRNEATGTYSHATVLGYTADGSHVLLTHNRFAEVLQTFLRPVSQVMFL